MYGISNMKRRMVAARSTRRGLAHKPGREADVATLEAYTRRKATALWERLPILVYSLMRCEMFGINWYHLLGLDLLSMVRAAHQDYSTMFKVFNQKISQLGFTDAKELLEENSERFRELFTPLVQVEEAVRDLTTELELFRKSNIGKAFSEASNLSHDLVKQRKQAEDSKAALRDKFKKEQHNTAVVYSEIKSENIKLEAAVDALRLAKHKAEMDVKQAQEKIDRLELRAEHAEAEVAALRDELDAFYESYKSGGHHHTHGAPAQAGMSTAWFSRPAEKEMRQRSEHICKKVLHQRGYSLQTLGLRFDCSELAMVTVENTLFFLGGMAGSENRLKVHTLGLDTGTVMEDIEISGKAPTARRGHHAFFFNDLETGPVIYVCGGMSWDASVRFNDMYCLQLTTRTWSQVVSTMPIGGVMSGSHYGPTMYLYGTSWDRNQPSLCALHSIHHAWNISASDVASQLSRQTSREAVPRALPPPEASAASSVSDWSRPMSPEPAALLQRETISEQPQVMDGQQDEAMGSGTFLTDAGGADDAEEEATHEGAPSHRSSRSQDGAMERDSAEATDQVAIVAVSPRDLSSEGGPASSAARDGHSSDVQVHGEEPSRESISSNSRSKMDAEHQWTLQRMTPSEHMEPQPMPSRVSLSARPSVPRHHNALLNRPASGSSAGLSLVHFGRQQPPRRARPATHAHKSAKSTIPGSAWTPPEDYRSWYQGSKALALMPEVKPPPRPARPDKRDSPAARFFGTNRHVPRVCVACRGIHMLLVGLQREMFQRSTKATISIPTTSQTQDWQAAAILRHVPQEGGRPVSGLGNTKGHEAGDLVDMKSLENWDTWINQHPGSLDAALATNMNLSTEDRRIMTWANHPRPRKSANPFP